MKKLSFIFIAIAGMLSLFSCKKDETKVVLTDFTAAQIQTPATGTSFVLLKANKDSVLTTFKWGAATYNPVNLGKPTYTLQYDTAGGTFASSKVLKSTTDLMYSITVGAMNQLIIAAGGQADMLATYQFRVKASLTEGTPSEDKYSTVITLGFTPFSTIVVVSPIYLLGDGSSVGWDNTKALEMTHIGDKGEFAIVDHLLATKFIKFIANRGSWAPMWGTDATGTNESGPLSYRPTEAVPDPPAIPTPAVEGDYRIVADTALLTYTVTATSAQLFLVGDGSSAGWVNSAGIPFVKVSPGIFTLTTTLNATGGLKFLEVNGAWAPQWGTETGALSGSGTLVYRPTESVPDPANIPTPGAGTYTITLNLATLTYTIVAGSGK
jgi:starch-binding outer membrane protein SusE/F